MAPAQKNVDPIEQLARSVDLLVKLKLHEIQGGRKQTEMILFLGGLGVTGSEITRLLGANPASVAPILSRAKAAAQKGKKAGRRGTRG